MFLLALNKKSERKHTNAINNTKGPYKAISKGGKSRTKGKFEGKY